MKILDDSHMLTPRQYFAVILRSEKKKIIRSQIELARYLKSIITESYSISECVKLGKSVREIDLAFK